MRVRLDVAYDGGAFAGWAVQPGRRTVQGVLEEALAVIVRRAEGERPRLVVAGRTDAGVHASGQVAHVDLSPAQLAALGRRRGGAGDASDVAERMTGLLGRTGDVLVRRSSLAPDGFDARFGAVFRRYRYRVADRLESCDPLDRGRTLLHPRRLDDALMAEAARLLPGLHDFGSFCRPRPGATTIRELHAFDWTRQPDGLLVAEVRADAFCRGMVRALVGAGIAVGSGRIAPQRVGELLQSPVRRDDFTVAPAHGLTLVEVGYPPDDLLADQAARTRALRELEPS